MPVEVSEEDSDLGDDEPEFMARVSSFTTELKSARTDDDIEEVSVRFEFDCDPILTSLGFEGGLRAVATFLASSEDTESEPDPDDGLLSFDEEAPSYPSSLPLRSSLSDLTPSDEASEASRAKEPAFRLRFGQRALFIAGLASSFRDIFFLRMGSSVETCIACGLAIFSPATDEVGDVLLVSLTVPMVLPSAIPAEATEKGCPTVVALALALATVNFRCFEDDLLPDVEDHASDDVGGGGKSCATTVAWARGTRWSTACSSEGGSRNS